MSFRYLTGILEKISPRNLHIPNKSSNFAPALRETLARHASNKANPCDGELRQNYYSQLNLE